MSVHKNIKQISPLQKSKIFSSRNDKQGDNHSPSTCHLESSREIQRSANTKKGCVSNHHYPLKRTSRSDSNHKKRIPRRDRLGVRFAGKLGGYFGGGIGTPLKWPSKFRSIKVKINITYITIIKSKIKHRFLHALRFACLVEMDNK